MQYDDPYRPTTTPNPSPPGESGSSPAALPWHVTGDAPPPPPPPPPSGPWGFEPRGPEWQPAPRPRAGRRAVAATLVVLFALGVGTGVAGARLVLNNSSNNSNSSATLFPTTPTSNGQGGGSSSSQGGSANTSSVAAKVTPGIVNINVTLSGGGGAAGTGMVITSTGEVLTNNHVIDGETSMNVEVASTGKTYSAHVVGYDLTEDIALVQIEGGGSFTTVSVGNSSTVQVGDAVVALGNALGRGGLPSVTSGNVTRLNQTITASDQSGGDVETVSGLIEVNAQIQPGDSGGPLASSSGNVIGMDTAANSAGGRFDQTTSTIAYAIPVNKAMQVVRQIQSGHGTSLVHVGASRALLGVGGQDSSDGSGVQVQTVEPGSPAAGAGITVGSIITALNGQTVDSNATLRNLIVQHDPGSSVSVSWTDPSGSTHTAHVVLSTGPPA